MFGLENTLENKKREYGSGNNRTASRTASYARPNTTGSAYRNSNIPGMQRFDKGLSAGNMLSSIVGSMNNMTHPNNKQLNQFIGDRRDYTRWMNSQNPAIAGNPYYDDGSGGGTYNAGSVNSQYPQFNPIQKDWVYQLQSGVPNTSTYTSGDEEEMFDNGPLGNYENNREAVFNEETGRWE